jgi:hypothetical protein
VRAPGTRKDRILVWGLLFRGASGAIGTKRAEIK